MPQLDATHRGPIVDITSWVTLVTMILITSIKVVTKWKKLRKLQLDDAFMIFAMLSAIGQCISTSVQVRSGLGQPQGNLSTQQFELYQKSTYISQIFYILTVYLAKMAALQFLITLTRQHLGKCIVKGALAFISAWLVIAIICISFQCNIPYTWNQASGRCFNLLAFWTANGVIDITTQFGVGLLPIYLLLNLHLPMAKKRLAMLSFIPNVTTTPLVALRLVYLFKTSLSSDVTFDTFDAALVTEIHTNYSVIASCIPFLKPVVDSLAIGLMTNEIRVSDRSQESRKYKTKHPFGLFSGTDFTSRNKYGWTKSQTPGYSSTVTAGKENDVELQEHGERFGSTDRMVIKETRTTDVSSDPKNSQRELANTITT